MTSARPKPSFHDLRLGFGGVATLMALLGAGCGGKVATGATSDGATTVDANGNANSSAGSGAASELTCLERTNGSADGVQAGGPAPLCPELLAEARCLTDEARDAVDRSCTVDSDCVKVFAAPSCIDSCGGDELIASVGADALQTAIDEINTSVCTRFESEGCSFFPSGCPGGVPWEAGCVNGECVAVTVRPVPTNQGDCVWGVDELLAEVGAEVAERVDCGLTNGADTARVEEEMACFADAPTDPGAEFAANYCTDCSILSTYVSTPNGELFHIRMESDTYGDALREASVERCAALEPPQSDSEMVTCVDATVLYECSDALR